MPDITVTNGNPPNASDVTVNSYPSSIGFTFVGFRNVPQVTVQGLPNPPFTVAGNGTSNVTIQDNATNPAQYGSYSFTISVSPTTGLADAEGDEPGFTIDPKIVNQPPATET